MPAEHQVPLVLDDALAAFDEDRLGRSLDLLWDLAREAITYIYCQEREAAYLKGRPGVTLQTLPG